MRKELFRIALLAAGTGIGFSQSFDVTSTVADGRTPLVVAPGNPRGVYPLSQFESIDLYAGKENVAFPLLTIGGRGTNAYTITAAVSNRSWTVENHAYMTPGQPMSTHYSQWAVRARGGSPYKAGYGPGIVMVKRTGDDIMFGLDNSQPCAFGKTFTHVVFVGPDGTEHALLPSNGSPYQPNNCTSGNASPNTAYPRGTTFVAFDGSNIQFQSAAVLEDKIIAGEIGLDGLLYSLVEANGTLVFPDGRRYEILNGTVQNITDRNGNETLITYVTGTVLVNQITDATGRTYDVNYGVADQAGCASNGVVCDRITYKGQGNASQQIIIRYSGLNGLVRSDLIQGSIFPSMNAEDITAGPFLSEVDLPNETAWKVFYSAYGEVAKVVLPTGGAVEYDHGAGLTNAGTAGLYWDGTILDNVSASPGGGPPWHPIIYRRLTHRREYNSAVSNEGNANRTDTAFETTDYDPFETASNFEYQGTSTVTGVTISPTGPVTVRRSGVNIPSTVVETHEFHGETFVPASVAPASPAKALYNDSTLPIFLTYPDVFEGKEHRTTVGPNVTSPVRVVERVFGWAGWSAEPCQENTTFADGTPTLIATKLFLYDRVEDGVLVGDLYRFGNQTDVYEYDFDAYLNRQMDPTNSSFVCQTPPASRTRRTHTDYKQDPAYLSATTFLPSLPVRQRTFGASGQLTDVTTVYDAPGGIAPGDMYAGVINATHCGSDSYAPRGNVTSISSLVQDLPAGGNSSTLTENYRYDCVGNLRAYMDPKVFTTTFGYQDQFAGGAPVSGTYAYRTSIQLPNGASVNRDYDYWAGKVRHGTDPNQVTTSFDYADPLNRLKHILRGEGAAGTIPSNSSITYHDDPVSTLSVQVSRDQLGADLRLLSATIYDAFGREKQSVVGGDDAIQVSTDYDGFSRVYQRSNPQKSGTASATDGSSIFSYDSAGRVLSVQKPDGSVVSTSYGVSTNQDSSKPVRTTVITDEDQKSRTLQYDGLDRLVGVVEFGDWATYTYDGLDNLTDVSQTSGSSQLRHFGYDSLKRLRFATNPENGTVSYTYDANGNVTSQTDARGVITCYGNLSGSTCDNSGYDNMNRVTRITFSSAGGTTTPSVQYCYDGHPYVANSGACAITQAPNQWLRRSAAAAWKIVNGSPTDVSFTAYTYDAGGRLTGSTQNTSGSSGPYPFTYAYYNDDSLASVQYPSSRTVTTCYDSNGRVKWVDPTPAPGACQSGSSAGSTAYASISAYAPQGAPQTLLLRNGLMESATYNNRLQMTDLSAGSLLTLGYFYCPSGGASCTSNNGNLKRQNIAAPEITGGLTLHLQQEYEYDGANRLSLVRETVMSGLPGGVTAGNWQTTHGYDGFGNMWATPTLNLPVRPPSDPAQYNAGTNRMTSRPNGVALPGDAYDAAGNLHNHPDIGLITYDAQNRVVTYSFNGGGAVSYVYDGEGHRVQKSGAAGTTTYVYDGFGQLAAEYGGNADAGTQYLTADHLGSTRLVTDAAGAVVQRLDYQPFGGTLAAIQGEGNRNLVTGYAAGTGLTVKFTGKERDSETGLDFFGARYFSGAQGRFTSPDPKMFPHDITDPQSWNKYSYTRNNPLRYVDPDGEDWQDYLKGAINAFTSDNTAGVGRISGGNGDFKTGQAIGDAVSTVTGTLEMIAGGGGEVLGGALDLTGVGALVGVPVNVVSAGVIAHGATATVEGGGHLVSAAFADNNGTSGGARAGKDFTRKGKAEVIDQNKQGNEGKTVCQGCSQETAPAQQSKKGVPTPGNETRVDHIHPKSKNGNGSPSNGQVLCSDCNLKKSNKLPGEN